MTNLLIEKFVESDKRKNKLVHVHFKTREVFSGMFIFLPDYEELKTKNYWRIVSSARIDEWKATGSLSCSRLFNGEAFTRLTDAG
jgi:hypothetical protein